jgi:hypothetical protein
VCNSLTGATDGSYAADNAPPENGNDASRSSGADVKNTVAAEHNSGQNARPQGTSRSFNEVIREVSTDGYSREPNVPLLKPSAPASRQGARQGSPSADSAVDADTSRTVQTTRLPANQKQLPKQLPRQDTSREAEKPSEKSTLLSDVCTAPVEVAVTPVAPFLTPKAALGSISGSAAESNSAVPDAPAVIVQPEESLNILIQMPELTAPSTPVGLAVSNEPASVLSKAASEGTSAAKRSLHNEITSGTQVSEIVSPHNSTLNQSLFTGSSSTVRPVEGLFASSLESDRRKAVIGTVATEPGATGATSTMPPFDLEARTEPIGAVTGGSAKTDPPRPVAAPAEALPNEHATRSLSSVSLEFTPDGARDVRVRLAERAGEVHVSVHSSDPSLTKNLREGVTDLAGALAYAGYNAETWTSGRQRQNPKQYARDVYRSRCNVSGADAELFGGILQQPTQEIS